MTIVAFSKLSYRLSQFHYGSITTKQINIDRLLMILSLNSTMVRLQPH